ncbi:hypothetical protein PVAND_014033 [Polypedilum vanderplanki]|uniref:Uncharacterized protein n=1 Tax=Polypedilum vanderplanki TaxID=319348 RepID=A0A9J6CSF3_POLVA|nr:hypothetical protein PVAND_014033 [Polypedilum vanderplanki]
MPMKISKASSEKNNKSKCPFIKLNHMSFEAHVVCCYKIIASMLIKSQYALQPLNLAIAYILIDLQNLHEMENQQTVVHSTSALYKRLPLTHTLIEIVKLLPLQ